MDPSRVAVLMDVADMDAAACRSTLDLGVCSGSGGEVITVTPSAHGGA
jgi:hypothetical protein